MIHGYLEYVQDFRLHGWAFDTVDMNRHLTVEITCGDVVLGRTVANVFRKDLCDNMAGDGCHGFVFDFTERLGSDDLHKIAARLVTEAGEVVSLQRLVYTPQEPDFDPAAQSTSLVYPGASSDNSQYPLFILGSTRSGTSAVAQALLATKRFWGHDEGQMLYLLAYLGDSVRFFYDLKARAGAINGSTLISYVPQSFLYSGLRRVFMDLMRTVAPIPQWFVKTLNHLMVQLAPQLLAMWPHAKFIFMKRRALEFIEPRRRKFPDLAFEDHCREWVATMAAWTRVYEKLGGRVLEIDQLYMARCPEVVATAVSTVAGLSADQSAAFLQSLAGDRPERTGSAFATALRLQDLDWDAAARAVFDSVCGPMMTHFGYSTDESYSVPGGSYIALRSGRHAVYSRPTLVPSLRTAA